MVLRRILAHYFVNNEQVIDKGSWYGRRGPCPHCDRNGRSGRFGGRVHYRKQTSSSLEPGPSGFTESTIHASRASYNKAGPSGSCGVEAPRLPRGPPKTPQQRAMLLETAMFVDSFKMYNDALLEDILDFFFPKVVKKDEFLCHQGERDTHFYIIEYGHFELIVDDKIVQEYYGSGCFGEPALQQTDKRLATVRAETDGKVWELSGETFRRHMSWVQRLRTRWHQTQLGTIPILQNLTTKEITKLAATITTKTYDEGDVIYKQGDKSDGMYLIEDGEVDVLVTIDKALVRVATLSRQAIFGETALISKRPRDATVVAYGRTYCAFIDIELFELALGNCLYVMQRDEQHFGGDVVRTFGSKEAMHHLRVKCAWSYLINDDPLKPLRHLRLGNRGNYRPPRKSGDDSDDSSDDD